MRAADPTAQHSDAPAADRIAHPLFTVYQWELEKLTAQFRTRLALAVVLLGPVLFAVGLHLATDVPADTLFGRWVGDSGFATPLVVLGFAGAWGFPLLTCLVAGDIFAAEDHHRTWSGLLTRSVDRRCVFGGKVLAAGTYSVLAVVVLALSSMLSGLVGVGDQPLVGLSGNLLPPARAAGLVLTAWASTLPAALSFAALGIAVSIATRNSLAGVLAPTVLGLLLQLQLLVGGALDSVRPYLPGASFQSWVGWFADPQFPGAAVLGVVASTCYTAGLLAVGWRLFRSRDLVDT